MKIELNREVCVGSATCVGFVPSAFKIGTDGQVVLLVDDVAGIDTGALLEAAGNCPVEAIRLIDEN
jgi:ferredoxin